MSNGTYGVINEGDYDVGVCEELIRKICGEDAQVLSRPAGGRVQVMNRMKGLLRSLEHVSVTGGPVDKALVIRDANGRDRAEVEQQMLARIAGQSFTFPNGVRVHAIRQEMETWLLADSAAIDRVARARNARDRVPPIGGALEEIQRPSQKLEEVLSRAGVNYTAQVCREIAREIDMAVLRNRCPSFQEFEQKVLDP